MRDGVNEERVWVKCVVQEVRKSVKADSTRTVFDLFKGIGELTDSIETVIQRRLKPHHQFWGLVAVKLGYSDEFDSSLESKNNC